MGEGGGAGQCHKLAREWGGTSLGDLGQTQTPVPSLVKLPGLLRSVLPIRNSPIEVAATWHRMKGNNSPYSQVPLQPPPTLSWIQHKPAGLYVPAQVRVGPPVNYSIC